jgi:hypothetical protein
VLGGCYGRCRKSGAVYTRDGRASGDTGRLALVPAVMIAALVIAALAIAGCGSSGKAAAAAGSNGYSQFLKFSVCMRSHGVTDFPDPQPGSGGGVSIQIGGSINPAAPSFKAAQAACSEFLPRGGRRAHEPSEQDRTEMLQISQCMRRHGIPDFPDPTVANPSGPGDRATVLDRDGVVLALPQSIDTRAPAFEHAAAACGFPE